MSLRSLSLPVDEVDIKQIKGSSNPLRVDLGDIEGLCSSINENGLLQPLIIRNHNGIFEVVAGNRRFEACRRLKWRKGTVPHCRTYRQGSVRVFSC